MPLDKLVVAKLLKPCGLQGELAVLPYADDPERFYSLDSCALETAEGRIIKQVQIRNVRLSGGKVFLSLEGYTSRAEAANITGLFLSVPRSAAVPLPPHTWYVCDLIGLKVSSTTEGYLGCVAEVLQNAAQDILVIRALPAPDILLPFLRRFIVKLDLTQGELLVTLPEGLYELYRTESDAL